MCFHTSGAYHDWECASEPGGSDSGLEGTIINTSASPVPKGAPAFASTAPPLTAHGQLIPFV